jgi:hypothetical protein
VIKIAIFVSLGRLSRRDQRRGSLVRCYVCGATHPAAAMATVVRAVENATNQIGRVANAMESVKRGGSDRRMNLQCSPRRGLRVLLSTTTQD